MASTLTFFRAPREKICLFVVAFLTAFLGELPSRAQKNNASPPNIAPPPNMETRGIPPIPKEVQTDVGKYLFLGGSTFKGWNSVRREPIVTTRIGNTTQLHLMQVPLGKREPIIRWRESVPVGIFRPKDGNSFVFLSDTSGDEQFQIYLAKTPPSKEPPRLLTDGKSRNLSPKWSADGTQLAYTSTQRNGKDSDVWLVNPDTAEAPQNLTGESGMGFNLLGWSHDQQSLLLSRDINSSRTELWSLNVASRERILLTKKGEDVSYSNVRLGPNESCLYAITDAFSDFREITRMDLKSGVRTPLTSDIPWDIEAFEISGDGRWLAFTSNEEGYCRLHLLDLDTGEERGVPDLGNAIISNLQWHPMLGELGFSLNTSQSPNDAHSFAPDSGVLTRWTNRPNNAQTLTTFSEPELVKIQSFDDLPISGWLYMPESKKFPPPRPLLISIHGGPSSQARPGFRGTGNYYINELGIAMLYPNVRGSSGYGKKFLDLDNGFKREDSVKDIGAFLKWTEQEPRIQKDRIGVMGASYGGYMTLSCMAHYPQVFRCGIDTVGIANFNTFLRDTSEYRKANRRQEYGDERNPQTHDFLERISPLNDADKIRSPLFVVQGQMDPRVPASEAEQIVSAVAQYGTPTWYMLAKDEGHGFNKKSNSDYLFLSSVLFLKQYLLGP